MISFVKRAAIEAEDWLRYNATVRDVVGWWKMLSEHLSRPEGDQPLARSIAKLCAAARYANNDATVARIQDTIRERVRRLNIKRVDWAEFVPFVEVPWSARSVILKPWISAREPGIVYVGFEMEWAKYLRHVNLGEFARRYTLVVAPSSNPHNLVNYVLPASFPQRVFTLINHDEDIPVLARVSANYRVVPLYTSHWVDPRIFRPLPRGERDIDLVMVAAWGKVKRHHVLFRAIREMPENLRIVLIGQDQEGRTAAMIREEAALYGVANRFRTLANATHAQVIETLCRARASVLLSRKEGSAVVIPESLFADTPVALLKNADNGSRAFINPSTGVLLEEGNLAGHLRAFVQRADEYKPRAWAEANISCFRSTEKLNDILREHALRDGQQWTRDILPLCWRPDPRVVYREDWVNTHAEREDILRRFGLEIGPREMVE